MLLGAPGIANRSILNSSNKKLLGARASLLGAPGLTTRNKKLLGGRKRCRTGPLDPFQVRCRTSGSGQAPGTGASRSRATGRWQCSDGWPDVVSSFFSLEATSSKGLTSSNKGITTSS